MFRRTPPVKDSLHNLLCSYSTLGSGIFSKFSLYNIIFISLLLVSLRFIVRCYIYSCPFTVFSQISWKVIPTTDFHALSLHIIFLVPPTDRTNYFLFIKSKWIIFQLHFKYFNFQEKDHPALSSQLGHYYQWISFISCNNIAFIKCWSCVRFYHHSRITTSMCIILTKSERLHLLESPSFQNPQCIVLACVCMCSQLNMNTHA